MAGIIRTQGKCGCKQAYQFVREGKYSFLRCPACGKDAVTYYIDARSFGMKTIWKDPKTAQLFRSYEAADRILTNMRKAVEDGTFNPADYLPEDLEKMKVKNLSDIWLQRIAIDKGSSYIRHCRSEFEFHINPYFGETDIRDIRDYHLDDFYYHLRVKPLHKHARRSGSLSAKAIKNVLTTLQTFMRAQKSLLPTVPPFPIVKVADAPVGWLNAEKQGAVVAAIPEQHRLIFEALIELSCRPGEVCALKKKDLIDGEVCIERAFDERGQVKSRKSGKVLYRGISQNLFLRLQAHARLAFPEAWLFLDEFGKPYSQARLYDIWKRASKGIADISLYAGTRRSRASQRRLELEKEIGKKIAAELGNTEGVAMKYYARSRGEQIK